MGTLDPRWEGRRGRLGRKEREGGKEGEGGWEGRRGRLGHCFTPPFIFVFMTPPTSRLMLIHHGQLKNLVPFSLIH